MSALLASLGLFGIAWLIHVAWWRSAPPLRQSAALVWLFVAVPVAAAAALVLGGPRLLPAEIPAALALYAGAAASYLIVYTGIEQSSPTLIIVRALARAQASGCSERELAEVVTDDVLLRPRMQALEMDGIVAPSAR